MSFGYRHGCEVRRDGNCKYEDCWKEAGSRHPSAYHRPEKNLARYTKVPVETMFLRSLNVLQPSFQSDHLVNPQITHQSQRLRLAASGVLRRRLLEVGGWR